MISFFENFLKKTHFNVYLLLIFFVSIFFLSHKYIHPTDWTTSEWLINYEGGFVRRGLWGEILQIINIFLNLEIRYLTYLSEIFLIFIFYCLIYIFFKAEKLNYLLILIFFSPVFLLYPLAENEALARKEYLYFCIYITYLMLLNNHKSIYLFNAISLPLMNLVWDGMIFYLIFFVFSYLIQRQRDKKELIKFSISFIPYIISLYFILLAKSNPIGLEKMCTSINEECFGAMLTLDKSLLWNINYVTSRFEISFLIRHIIVICLIFFPIISLFFFEKRKIFLGNTSFKNSLFYFQLLVIFQIFVFMLIGYDWGRWINIGYTFSVLNLFFLFKNNLIDFSNNKFFIQSKKFHYEYKKAALFIMVIYIFSWNLKVIMTDDLGSLPYLRILNKIIDYL